MPRPVTLVLTIRDGKSEDAQTLINLENQDTATLAELLDAAAAHQLLVDPLLLGQIVRCGLVIDVPLESGLKTSADPDADVEETALFIFQSSGTNTTRFNLPTFDKSKILIGLVDVDLTDSDVADLVSGLLAGLDGVAVQDMHGDGITEILKAYRQIVKSRV